MKGIKYSLVLLLVLAALPCPASAGEPTGETTPVFASGVLLDLSAVLLVGIYNSYTTPIPLRPHLVLGYGDIDFQFSFARLYYADGWEDGPFYPALSMAAMLSPEFGWYHPQMGIGAWLSSLPRSSPEDEWEISPGDAPSADTDFFRSWFLRAAPFRFGFDIGPLSLDFSLLDFFYGSIIPLTAYPGFRIVGTTVIGVNFGSIGISYSWRKR